MVSSSAARFIDAALQATGHQGLSYTHPGLKWLIRDHLLSLLDDYPSLSPHSDTFTSNDGAAAHLLHAHGLLPVSPSVPHVLVTIWIHQGYPFKPPFVYVFPNADKILVRDHPFFDSSGAVTSFYLNEWCYPESNLVGLARNLVEIFRLCHPYDSGSGSGSGSRRADTPASAADACLASRREAVDRLTARLISDAKQLQAQFDADFELSSSRQNLLRDRARAIDAGRRELVAEVWGLERALKEVVEYEAKLTAWLEEIHGGWESVLATSFDEAVGFEGSEAGTERRLLEEEAAVIAIDDVVDALDKALAAEVLDFGSYMKQVRSLAREQFFHKARIINIQRSRKRLP